MKKYTLIKNKITGERGVRNNIDGVVVRESENSELYMELRRKAIKNYAVSEKNMTLRNLGLKRVKGSLGGIYWE